MADLKIFIDEIDAYSSPVDEELVAALYTSLASTLVDRDASSVACSDKDELDVVKKNFIAKKLGVADEEKADAAIAAVCALMDGDRTKNRLVFYYLLTVELGCVEKLTE